MVEAVKRWSRHISSSGEAISSASYQIPATPVWGSKIQFQQSSVSIERLEMADKFMHSFNMGFTLVAGVRVRKPAAYVGVTTDRLLYLTPETFHRRQTLSMSFCGKDCGKCHEIGKANLLLCSVLALYCRFIPINSPKPAQANWYVYDSRWLSVVSSC